MTFTTVYPSNNFDGKAKPSYLIDGCPVTKAVFDRAFRTKKEPKGLKRPQADQAIGQGGQRPGTWPMISMNMCVHPSQVAEANAKLKAGGSTAYHKRNGLLVIPDNGQRKKVLKIKERICRESFC